MKILNLRNRGRWSANCYYFNLWGKNYLIDAWELHDEKKMHSDLDLDYIFITHWHYDHIESLEKLIESNKRAKIIISKDEYDFLFNPNLNLSIYISSPLILPKKYDDKIIKIRDEEEIFWIKIIKAPWHTAWWLCFYLEEFWIMFTWDTLFDNAVWRTDLPTSDEQSLIESLKLLSTFPKNTHIKPWHWRESTISTICDMDHALCRSKYSKRYLINSNYW